MLSATLQRLDKDFEGDRRQTIQRAHVARRCGPWDSLEEDMLTRWYDRRADARSPQDPTCEGRPPSCEHFWQIFLHHCRYRRGSSCRHTPPERHSPNPELAKVSCQKSRTRW